MKTEYPGKITIGTCSICGGPVQVHEHWFSITPDTPTCASCGATKADNHGPVIPMERAPRMWTSIDGASANKADMPSGNQ